MKLNKWSLYKSLSAALCLAASLFAAPHVNEQHEFLQPDGKKVPVIVNGDEFYQRVEDLNGRTLIRAADGWICYARLNTDSSDFIAGERYSGLSRAVSGSEPVHLELKPSAIQAKVEKTQEFMFGDENSRAENRAGLVPYPVVGERKGITILIEFSDQAAVVSKAEVETMLNGDQGSTVKNYFKTVSGGKLTYTNQVVGYYKAKNPKTYYDTPQQGGRVQELLNEALAWVATNHADLLPQLTQENKKLTAVNFLYAGSPSNGWANGLWPHMNFTTLKVGTSGYTTNGYQITGLNTQSKNIGTFCHENGHLLLRYPDLYPYNQGGSNHVAQFDLMSAGGSGNTPAPMNPYFRKESGWLTYEDITTVTDATIQVNSNDMTRAIQYRHPTNSNVFFVLESIQKTGQWSSFAPGNGLVCWKVNKSGDNQQSQTLLQVEVAGGTGASALMSNRTGVAFSATTTPAATWIRGIGGNSNLVVKNLSASGPTMTFDLGNGGTLEKTFSLSTIATNGTVTVSPTGERFKPDTKVTLTATPKAGYDFTSWSGDLSGSTNPAIVTVTKDMVITANFTAKPKDYITMPTGTNNVVAIKGDTLFYDDGGPAEEYSVQNSGTITFKSSIAGKKVQISFLEFAIEDSSTAPNGQGGPIWDSLQIFSGSTTTNSLGRWFGSMKPGTLTSTAADGALTVAFHSDEATVGAGWKAKLSLIDMASGFPITVTAKNGSVKKIPEKALYEKGETVKVVAVPSEGWFFTGWGGVKSGFGDTIAITVNEAVSFDAFFHKKKLLNTDFGIAGGNRANHKDLSGSFHAYSYEGATVDSSKLRGIEGIRVSYSIPKQPDANTWPGIGVGTYVEQSLKGVDYVRVTYRSEKPLTLQLSTSDDKEAPYVADMPAATEWNTVDIAVTSLKAASWGTVVEYDPAKMQNVNFAPEVDVEKAASEGTIEIAGLYLIGEFTPVSLLKTAGSATALGVAIHRESLALTLPEAGPFTVQLFALNGRKLYELSSTAINAGVQTFGLSRLGLASGVVAARVQTKSGSLVKTLMIQ